MNLKNLDEVGNENEFGEDGSNEGGEGERTVLCEGWGQEIGVSGCCKIFGDKDTNMWIRNRTGKETKIIGALSEPDWKWKS